MLGRWLALGLGAAIATATLAAGYQVAARPATYREAVSETLIQRGRLHLPGCP